MKPLVLTEDLQERVVREVLAPTGRDLVDITGLRQELDGYYRLMKTFPGMDLEDVFLALAGFCARAAEIRTTIVRNETRNAAAFRTREIDPFLEQCDAQFKIFSRLQAFREFEFKVSGGAP